MTFNGLRHVATGIGCGRAAVASSAHLRSTPTRCRACRERPTHSAETSRLSSSVRVRGHALGRFREVRLSVRQNRPGPIRRRRPGTAGIFPFRFRWETKAIALTILRQSLKEVLHLEPGDVFNGPVPAAQPKPARILAHDDLPLVLRDLECTEPEGTRERHLMLASPAPHVRSRPLASPSQIDRLPPSQRPCRCEAQSTEAMHSTCCGGGAST